MVKFLQSADWQLGMTRHFLTGEAQARFSAARLDVIERMGNLAVDERCQFVIVCGDVFDSNQVERQVLMRAFEKMAAFPQVTFYLLPGNHDPLDASSIYRSQNVHHVPAQKRESALRIRTSGSSSGSRIDSRTLAQQVPDYRLGKRRLQRTRGDRCCAHHRGPWGHRHYVTESR